MRVLFVNAGLPGVPVGYAASIRESIQGDFNYPVKEVSPLGLTVRDIVSFRPEVVFVLHGNLTPLRVIRFARKSGIKTVLWIIEDPYELDVHNGEWLFSYDYIFTNELKAVGYYRTKYCQEKHWQKDYPGRKEISEKGIGPTAGIRKAGGIEKGENIGPAAGIRKAGGMGPARVYYLPWCTNPAVYHPLAVEGRYRSDLCFVGMGFKNRVKVLNQLAGFLSSLKVRLIGNWKDWGARLHPVLSKAVIPQIHNPEEIACYYRGASINLNIHRDPADSINVNTAGLGAASLNNRTFDIAGTGGFQLIDNSRSELSYFYNIGREIVSFNSPEELLSRIKYYLKHPEERRRIGENAYFRTVNYHTFKKRLERVFRIINAGGEEI